MATTVINPDNTVSVTLTPDELSTYEWVIRQHGDRVMADLITNWLAGHARVKAEADMKTYWDAYWKAATPEEQAQIKTLLDAARARLDAMNAPAPSSTAQPAPSTA